MHSMRIGRVLGELDGLGATPELTVDDILGLPESLRRLLSWIVRSRAVTCEQMARFLCAGEKDAFALITELARRDLIEHVPTCGIPIYRVCMVPRTIRPPAELRDEAEESALS